MVTADIVANRETDRRRLTNRTVLSLTRP